MAALGLVDLLFQPKGLKMDLKKKMPHKIMIPHVVCI